MREELASILAEPGTGSPLRLEVDGRSGDDIEEGRLISEETGRAYPIVRGVPRFVDGDCYAETFGLQWNRFRGVQLDSQTGASYSRRRFDAEAGWSADELRGKWVLDAGCGAGRFAEIAAARGAKLVAFDYSSAVDAARRTLSPYPEADVVQGSLLEPPFRPGVFDFAYCIGVVQHTPDRDAAIAGVLHGLKPGGRFSFTIYARKPLTRLNAKYLVRPLTRRLPPSWLLGLIEGAMPLLFPVTNRLFRLPAIGKLAAFTIPVATYLDRDDFTKEQQYQEAVLDTFDMLSPRYDAPMTWTEVEAALRRSSSSAWSFRSKVPINVVGVR